MKRTILTGVLVLAAGFSSGLWSQQPAAPAAPAPPSGPKAKSKAEGEAINAVVNAVKSGDPDAIIKSSEELLTKYSDTDFKEYALSMEARAYHEKRDDINAQAVGERALEINPKDFLTELLVGEVIEVNIKDHDLDRADKLAKCNKLFTSAIEDIKTATKPNKATSDADWEAGQKFTTAQAHNDLGMLAIVQKKWDDGVKEFLLALEGDPDQDAYGARLALAYANSGKPTEAIAVCDKLLAKPSLNPIIKSYVTNVKTQAANSLKK
jgi:tetratricopeptide (TPR) repeat protein